MDTKALRLEIKDEARGEVTAVFSTFNVVDSDGDVTRPGAFEDGATIPISAYGHASWDGVLPVGIGRIVQTPTEAIMKGRFFLDTQAGHDTFTVVKELGELGQWSYGYEPVKHSFGDFNGRRVRFLEQLKTHEVSPVLVGAGVGVRTLSAKSAGTPAAGDGLDDATRAWIRQLATINQAEITLAEMKRSDVSARDREVILKAAAEVTEWYVEVAPAMVAERERRLAESAIGDACIRLKYSPVPAVKWFRPETQVEADYMEIHREPALSGFGWIGDIVGKAHRDSNTIWLRIGQADAELYLTAGHEVAHLAGADETTAQAFEVVARDDYRRRVSAR